MSFFKRTQVDEVTQAYNEMRKVEGQALEQAEAELATASQQLAEKVGSGMLDVHGGAGANVIAQRLAAAGSASHSVATRAEGEVARIAADCTAKLRAARMQYEGKLAAIEAARQQAQVSGAGVRA